MNALNLFMERIDIELTMLPKRLTVLQTFVQKMLDDLPTSTDSEALEVILTGINDLLIVDVSKALRVRNGISKYRAVTKRRCHGRKGVTAAHPQGDATLLNICSELVALKKQFLMLEFLRHAAISALPDNTDFAATLKHFDDLEVFFFNEKKTLDQLSKAVADCKDYPKFTMGVNS